MGGRFRVRQWPHFFEKPVEESSYHSTKILGQLYDMVERVEFKPCYDLPPNEYLMTAFSLTDAELEEAKKFKSEYDQAMRRIMAQHEIQTEFEVWSTFVMSHSNSNDYKFHEEIGEISFTLKERFRKQIIHSCADRTTEMPRKVVAMYVVTQTELAQTIENIEKERIRATPRLKSKFLSGTPLTKKEIEKLPLISFPWLFPELLVDITGGRTSVAQDYSGPGHCDVATVHEEAVEMQELSDSEEEEECDEDLSLEQFDEDADVPVEEIDDNEEPLEEPDSDEQPVEEFVSVQADEATGEEIEVGPATPDARDAVV